MILGASPLEPKGVEFLRGISAAVFPFTPRQDNGTLGLAAYLPTIANRLLILENSPSSKSDRNTDKKNDENCNKAFRTVHS